MREFFNDYDEGCSDEASPIGIPRVVDHRRVCLCSHRGLLGVDLVVAIPVLHLTYAFTKLNFEKITYHCTLAL